jgi:hypothetical protein
MTNREWLSKMSDDDLADWLCKQMFLDYGVDGKDPLLDTTRFHTVRNFLKMEHTEEEDE